MKCRLPASGCHGVFIDPADPLQKLWWITGGKLTASEEIVPCQQKEI
jgi:hypothetical protein